MWVKLWPATRVIFNLLLKLAVHCHFSTAFGWCSRVDPTPLPTSAISMSSGRVKFVHLSVEGLKIFLIICRLAKRVFWWSHQELDCCLSCRWLFLHLLRHVASKLRLLLLSSSLIHLSLNRMINYQWLLTIVSLFDYSFKPGANKV